MQGAKFNRTSFEKNTINKALEEINIIRTKPIFINDESISLNYENYKINTQLKLIDKGSYGQVFKYKDLNYNKYFALKRLMPLVFKSKTSLKTANMIILSAYS